LYLSYERTEKSWEEKLRRKRSIGIGGHVNIIDRSQLPLFITHPEKTLSFILQSVWREINEEIYINSGTLNDPHLVCFINDDSDAVGWKHFGIVWLLRIREPKVSTKKGGGLGKLEFGDLPYLAAHKYDYEKWSRLLIDYLAEMEERGEI